MSTVTRPPHVLDVAAIKADFPLLARTLKGGPIVYLDSAASSQKPSKHMSEGQATGAPGTQASTAQRSAPLQNTPSSQSAFVVQAAGGAGGLGFVWQPMVPTSSARPSTMPQLKSIDRFRLLSVL